MSHHKKKFKKMTKIQTIIKNKQTNNNTKTNQIKKNRLVPTVLLKIGYKFIIFLYKKIRLNKILNLKIM